MDKDRLLCVLQPKMEKRGPWDKKGDLKGTQIHKKRSPRGPVSSKGDPIGHSDVMPFLP